LGGPFDRWDLEASSCRFVAARLRLAVEEHGHGRQLLRVRIWPRVSLPGLALLLAAAVLLGFDFALNTRPIGAAVAAALVAIIAVRLATGSAAAIGMYLRCFVELAEPAVCTQSPHRDESKTTVLRQPIHTPDPVLSRWARAPAFLESDE
jgi:hypothetical protein